MEDFLAINHIPAGPMLLRDHSLEFSKNAPADSLIFKQNQISSILDFYPSLNFILIGDSGQHDAVTYHRIARRYPGRILAIYIRDVGIARRRAEISRISAELKEEQGIDLLMVRDTKEAARHAYEHGFTGKNI